MERFCGCANSSRKAAFSKILFTGQRARFCGSALRFPTFQAEGNVPNFVPDLHVPSGFATAVLLAEAPAESTAQAFVPPNKTRAYVQLLHRASCFRTGRCCLAGQGGYGRQPLRHVSRGRVRIQSVYLADLAGIR